jgi:uncharacterized protein (DUF1778 family)
MRGMRETKIRFGVEAWKLIQAEAKLEGVSASQFVREAALVRAVYRRTLRDPSDHYQDILDYLRQQEG